MTIDEARIIAAICSTADGGECSSCTEGIRVQLQAAFPRFVWTYEEDPIRISVRPAGGGNDDAT
jgi:hypothetical protein